MSTRGNSTKVWLLWSRILVDNVVNKNQENTSKEK